MNAANIAMYSHIGAELVVIGGLSIYFYRRQSQMQAQIDELKKQNQELAQLMANQNALLTSLMGGKPAKVSQKSKKSASSQKAQTKKSSKKKRSPPRVEPAPPQSADFEELPPDDEGEEQQSGFDDAELDRELDEQLEEETENVD